jgi:hypothetical protein
MNGNRRELIVSYLVGDLNARDAAGVKALLETDEAAAQEYKALQATHQHLVACAARAAAAARHCRHTTSEDLYQEAVFRTIRALRTIERGCLALRGALAHAVIVRRLRSVPFLILAVVLVAAVTLSSVLVPGERSPAPSSVDSWVPPHTIASFALRVRGDGPIRTNQVTWTAPPGELVTFVASELSKREDLDRLQFIIFREDRAMRVKVSLGEPVRVPSSMCGSRMFLRVSDEMGERIVRESREPIVISAVATTPKQFAPGAGAATAPATAPAALIRRPNWPRPRLSNPLGVFCSTLSVSRRCTTSATDDAQGWRVIATFQVDGKQFAGAASRKSDNVRWPLTETTDVRFEIRGLPAGVKAPMFTLMEDKQGKPDKPRTPDVSHGTVVTVSPCRNVYIGRVSPEVWKVADAFTVVAMVKQ